MPREKQDYQDNLNRVVMVFPNKEMIPLKDVAEWLGMNQRLLQKLNGFPVKKIQQRYYVPAVGLAKWLS